MRRHLATALTITAALVLAGCTGDAPEAEPTASADASPDAAAEASPDDVAALEAVVAEGDLGAAPTLTFDQPFAVSAPVARVDLEGDGDEIGPEQKVTIQYVAVSGDDGTVLGSTWESDAPEQLALDDPTLIAALRDTLVGQKVGVRVLFAAPGAEETEQSAAYPATLMAIEVTDARDIPTRAEGDAVEPPAGLPLVTLADDGEPSIEVPAGTAEPTTLVAQTLIEGSGPVVETGQQITVQYTGWLFDGTEFDSSWGGESPFTTPIGTQSVIPGWDEGLVGKTVGSQVLLVIPSDKGYGPEGSGETIPPDSTLIFVVDILDAA
ncbi:FKBP-type peptidyl-prolyl cis-trans isomerase [Actinotalea solisilvae]|uniref:FKBP-type peptidyl-prolyl cis-trans isomerase n=1 Tax=Actinotalea solisilvae TaxID=2072922 RepID=UPI0027DAC1F7|nr:FKBP-type peptidyl-prolyl cis-trans isomerase [Actinotalea solisilvae]